MSIPTQAEYEQREASDLWRKLNEIEHAPLSERKENAKTFAETLINDPALVAERIGWLLGGSYGYGAYVKARSVFTFRGNKNAVLLTLVAALEWGVTARDTAKLYKSLTQTQQDDLNARIAKEIQDAQQEE